MKTFKELGLSNETIAVLKTLKIETPSDIQEKAIPLVLAGKDIIGGSATGSGKTLAFASAIIENLEKNGRVQAFILEPTRELANQVATSIRKLSKHKKLNVTSIYGGVNIESQIRSLKTADVVVGTPGRILDHLHRETLNLGKVKFLVLDEVDRMFDMGFQVDVEKILEQCSSKRQTMLFSATISFEMDYLAKKYTKKPIEISVKSYVDASKLEQVYYDIPRGLKFSLFVYLLKKEESNLAMVFCATRRNVDFVAKNLINLGINAKALHGGMVQNKRTKVLNEFNSKNGTDILVCTDVAARGLDIKGVSHIYNYDMSKTSDEYIHRIGRTARAGKKGIAINLLASRDYENFTNILRDEKLNIKEIKPPKLERVSIIVDKPQSSRGSERRSFGRPQSRNAGRPQSRNNRRPTSKPIGNRDERRSRRSPRDSGRSSQRRHSRLRRSQRNTKDSRGRSSKSGRSNSQRRR